MDPIVAITIANGLLDLLAKLAPELQKAFSAGQVSAEDQAAVRARFDALREASAFIGPEWQKE